MIIQQDYIDYADTSVRYEFVQYLRVSDRSQVVRGSGLSSQETRGREFAKLVNVPIVKVFHDDGVSGKLLERPDIQKMLKFLKAKKKNDVQYVVLIDDISRLARDIRVHFDLRDAIEETGALLDSPSNRFKMVRDADGTLNEGILAMFAMHFRQKGAETSRNRKWARITAGYWPYKAPIGYKFENTKVHGNMLVRCEPDATILTEAFEGFASGHYASQAEVKRFLENHPQFSGKRKTGTITYQRVTDLITHPIYAGYVESKELDVSLRQGKHEPLISLKTFEKMQKRREQGSVAPARKNIHVDFPLRGFVTCGTCSKPLYASWSRSSTGKRYPYYFCQTKGCGKNIRREKLEGDFMNLLQHLSPNKTLSKIIVEMLNDVWNQRLAQTKDIQKTLQQEIKKIEAQIEKVVDKLLVADNPTIENAFTRKVEGLEKEKFLKVEQLENGFQTKHRAEDILELSLKFFSNPCKLWGSGDFYLRQLVLRLVFSERLAYHHFEGFRTPETTLPFNVLGGFCPAKSQMVRPRRPTLNILHNKINYL